MKPPHTITDEELEKYSNDHLTYEVGMLFWTSDILYHLANIKDKGRISEAINNALLNSFFYSRT